MRNANVIRSPPLAPRYMRLTAETAPGMLLRQILRAFDNRFLRHRYRAIPVKYARCRHDGTPRPVSRSASGENDKHHAHSQCRNGIWPRRTRLSGNGLPSQCFRCFSRYGEGCMRLNRYPGSSDAVRGLCLGARLRRHLGLRVTASCAASRLPAVIRRLANHLVPESVLSASFKFGT